MKLSIKRAYEARSSSDGERVLVDRLWPRGVRRADAHIDVWAKDLAPSPELRKWFHTAPEKRYEEFHKQYAKELAGKKGIARELFRGRKKRTLVTAVRDMEHSHIPTLVSFLEKSL